MLMTVFVHPRNPKNVIKARLLGPGQDTNSKHPLAILDPVTNTFTLALEASKKPYHLVLDYIEVDPHEHCALYDVTVSTKSLMDIMLISTGR